jgi:NADH:ubiquinone oxidoreductase subunit 6 (subunit J)
VETIEAQGGTGMSPAASAPIGFLSTLNFPDLVFLLMALLIVVCGGIVVFSRNIVHSAFALLGTFSGVAGLYGLAQSNFLAAVQLLVYVGGILIIILFAIMLTRGIQNAAVSNPSTGLIPATIFGLIMAVSLIFIAVRFPWKPAGTAPNSISTELIGESLLTKYLIPFEVLSVLLLAVLVGSVMIIRKEMKEQGGKEVEE